MRRRSFTPLATRLLAALGLALMLAAPRPSDAQEAHAPSGETHATAAAAAAPHAPAEAGHDAEASHSSGKKINILGFEPGLAFYTFLVFAVLVGVLYKYAWGPLAEALEAREHKLQHTYDEAERVRGEAASLLEQHRQQMAAAQEQVRGIIEEARRDATYTADSIVKRAQEEAEASKVRAQREISMAKDEALTEIWSKSADLAVSVAQRVLARELGPDEQKRMVEHAIQQLPAKSGNGAGGKKS